MAFIDYYKILGVDKNIPQNEVRKAYLRRSKQMHPDLHPDDPKATKKFQMLNEAYEVINDPEKRKKYDRYGEHWRDADAYEHAYGGCSGGDSFQNFMGGGGFSDFFENIFGQQGGFHARSAASPRDAEASVTIDLYTALLGGEVIIQTPDGKRLKLKVPPCTQPESKVRLKGKGHDNGYGTRGDLILTYHVQMPVSLSEEQRQLLMKLWNM